MTIINLTPKPVNIFEVNRADLRLENSPSARALCTLCNLKIQRGEQRVHFRLSNFHAGCFTKLMVSIPGIREMLNDAIQALTIERMEGK